MLYFTALIGGFPSSSDLILICMSFSYTRKNGGLLNMEMLGEEQKNLYTHIKQNLAPQHVDLMNGIIWNFYFK